MLMNGKNNECVKTKNYNQSKFLYKEHYQRWFIIKKIRIDKPMLKLLLFILYIYKAKNYVFCAVYNETIENSHITIENLKKVLQLTYKELQNLENDAKEHIKSLKNEDNDIKNTVCFLYKEYNLYINVALQIIDRYVKLETWHFVSEVIIIEYICDYNTYNSKVFKEYLNDLKRDVWAIIYKNKIIATDLIILNKIKYHYDEIIYLNNDLEIRSEYDEIRNNLESDLDCLYNLNSQLNIKTEEILQKLNNILNIGIVISFFKETNKYREFCLINDSRIIGIIASDIKSNQYDILELKRSFHSLIEKYIPLFIHLKSLSNTNTVYSIFDAEYQYRLKHLINNIMTTRFNDNFVQNIYKLQKTFLEIFWIHFLSFFLISKPKTATNVSIKQNLCALYRNYDTEEKRNAFKGLLKRRVFYSKELFKMHSEYLCKHFNVYTKWYAEFYTQTVQILQKDFTNILNSIDIGFKKCIKDNLTNKEHLCMNDLNYYIDFENSEIHYINEKSYCYGYNNTAILYNQFLLYIKSYYTIKHDQILDILYFYDSFVWLSFILHSDDIKPIIEIINIRFKTSIRQELLHTGQKKSFAKKQIRPSFSP